MPKTILLVIYSLGPGGAERVMNTLASRWAEHSRVILATLSPDPDHYAVDPRVERVRVPPDRMRFGRPIHAIRKVLALRRLIRAERPDIIVSFITATNIATLVAATGRGIPVVVSERTSAKYPFGVLARIVRRLTYPAAAALVAQTQRTADGLTARRYPPRVVIPNPAPPPRENGSVDKEAADPLVVSVGRLSHEKGFDLLLKAFARTRRRHPTARLVIAGDGPGRADLERLAAALDVADAVRFPGVLADTQRLIGSADVYVLPSRYEGFPNVLLEAMAAGRAVVASDCDAGPREIIEHGVDGLLVPTGDLEELGAAIDRLLADAEERRSLGERARRAVRRYSIERVEAEWSGLFRQILGSADR